MCVSEDPVSVLSAGTILVCSDDDREKRCEDEHP